MKTKILIILVGLIIILIIGFLIFYFLKKGSPESSELNIIEKTDLSLNIKIDQDDISDYLDFIKKNQQYAKPTTWAEFLNEMEETGTYLGLYPPGKTTGDLEKRIIDELNIEFLLTGINQRQLAVTITKIQEQEKYIEKDLLFTDPEVGSFSVLLLIPKQKEMSCPAIIGLHGHGGDNISFKNNYFGKDLAEAGFIVILPSFRAMDCLEAPEETITQELILNGFTLMGLRIYETFLLIKYLKYVDFVDNDKIGIMGHSGGSDVAYLTSIINQDLRALVFDFYPKPDSLCEGRVHCETIPGLAYYKEQINDPSTLKIPSQKFEYDYPEENDKEEVINFFKEKLSEE